MTRRGSLVYYLAAWVCGCFFASLVVWIAPQESRLSLEGFRGLRIFFFIYFLCLAVGAIPLSCLRWYCG